LWPYVAVEWQLIEATQGRNPMLREDFGHLMEGLAGEDECRALIKQFVGPELGGALQLHHRVTDTHLRVLGGNRLSPRPP